MLSLIFSLDYEIHGNGEGSPHELMVEPTERLLALFDEYGAKLTIMADAAEILRFKQYFEETGRDDFSYQAIVQQLQKAVRDGHDVQLHIHSSYLKAQHCNGFWKQDWSEYNFAGLSPERMEAIVRMCKGFLETVLRPVDPDYRCIAFRAANWSVSPSPNVVASLVNNGIEIDTSVFKFGQRRGLVSFDYSAAHDALLPWPASPEDICRRHEGSALWEFPIYSEARRLGAFLTPSRVHRALLSRLHRLSDGPGPGPSPEGVKTRKGLSWLLQKHAWKADFNQCSGRQLVGSLVRAEKRVPAGLQAPFVLIGHSKLFTRWNAESLRPLLRFVTQHPGRFDFGVFKRFASLTSSGSKRGANQAVYN